MRVLRDRGESFVMSIVLLFRKGGVHQAISQLQLAGFILYSRWKSTAESNTNNHIPPLPNYSGLAVNELAYAK